MYSKYNVKGFKTFPSPGGRKKWFTVLLLLLVILLLSAGYYFFIFAKDTEDTEKTSSAHSQNNKSASLKTVKNNIGISPGKFRSLYSQAQKSFKNKEYVKTRKICLKLLNSGIKKNTLTWKKLVILLGKANVKIFFSDAPFSKKLFYTVRSGDSLDRIAKKFNMSVEGIQRSNNLDSVNSTIHPGEQLSIYKAKWKILVDKSEYRLYLYDGDEIFKVYKVGIGKQNRTPSGTFDVVDKIPDPDWEHDGRKYPFGSPENVLGTRWMRITPSGDTPNYSGLGIHGTWEADSVGKKVSNGCIRMRNKDIEELYAILPKYPEDGKYTEMIIKE